MPGSGLGVQMQRWNILLVDDDQEVLQAQSMYFDCMGHNVIMQTCPIKACEYLQHGEASVDLLVTDFMMPDMNGLELVQAARSNGYVGPALMISGCHGGVHAGETSRLDVDVMSKPVRYYELVTYVERLQDRISLSETLRMGAA